MTSESRGRLATPYGKTADMADGAGASRCCEINHQIRAPRGELPGVAFGAAAALAGQAAKGPFEISTHTKSQSKKEFVSLNASPLIGLFGIIETTERS